MASQRKIKTQKMRKDRAKRLKEAEKKVRHKDMEQKRMASKKRREVSMFLGFGSLIKKLKYQGYTADEVVKELY